MFWNFGKSKKNIIEENEPARVAQQETTTNDCKVLYVNDSITGLNGPTFEFEVDFGCVKTAMVSLEPETNDLFIILTKFNVNHVTFPGFEKPRATKQGDIVEVKPQQGDVSIFRHGQYRVGALDGDAAPLIFLQALGVSLAAASDNPLNIHPEEAHDVFYTLRLLSEGHGLQLERIAPEYTMLYDIVWPDFSRNIYNTETFHGYKLAEEYRISPSEMVIYVADLAYNELGYEKPFRDLNNDELKVLNVLAGYKLVRVIYDKAPDDHQIKKTD